MLSDADLSHLEFVAKEEDLEEVGDIALDSTLEDQIEDLFAAVSTATEFEEVLGDIRHSFENGDLATTAVQWTDEQLKHYIVDNILGGTKLLSLKSTVCQSALKHARNCRISDWVKSQITSQSAATDILKAESSTSAKQCAASSERLDFVAKARGDWESRLRYQLQSLALSQKRALIAEDSADTLSDDRSTDTSETVSLRYIYTGEDLIDCLSQISNPNARSTLRSCVGSAAIGTRADGNWTHIGWGLIRVQLHTADLQCLRLRYSQLHPKCFDATDDVFDKSIGQTHGGKEALEPTSARVLQSAAAKKSALKSASGRKEQQSSEYRTTQASMASKKKQRRECQRLERGEAIVGRGYIPEMREFAKRGLPHGLRREYWPQMCGLPKHNSAAMDDYFEQLLDAVDNWDVVTDSLYRLDVEHTLDHCDFFPFDDFLNDLSLAFSRDPLVPALSTLPPNVCPLHTVPSSQASKSVGKDEEGIDELPTESRPLTESLAMDTSVLIELASASRKVLCAEGSHRKEDSKTHKQSKTKSKKESVKHRAKTAKKSASKKSAKQKKSGTGEALDPPMSSERKRAMRGKTERELAKARIMKPKCVPPCGVVPFHRQLFTMAPLCYVFAKPRDAYFMYRHLYCHYFVALHSVNSRENGLLHLCRSFERWAQYCNPHAFFHCIALGVAPLSVVFPWMFSAFGGHLYVTETLQLWDLILAFDDLQLVAVLCAAIFGLRAQRIRDCESEDAIRALFQDIRGFRVLPVIQHFLFTVHKT